MMPSREKYAPDVPRVLVVEDDALVGETIAAMLDGHYLTALAETADEALLRLDASVSDWPQVKPHLILLDCFLPGGGLSRILTAADEHSIPVVLISGDPHRAMQIDASRPFLGKPFNQASLLQVLRVACG